MKKQNLFFILLSGLFLLSCQDSPVEPENNFVNIYLKYDFKNELNTFENTFQKDLILDGVIKIKFWLTAKEQNSILEKAKSINYFSLPESFQYIPQDSIMVFAHPNPGEQILRIKYQKLDKTTVWTYPLLENNSQFDDLLELRKFIITLIESKPEYKKLPVARGGYV
jgi:hypothetical protein